MGVTTIVTFFHPRRVKSLVMLELQTVWLLQNMGKTTANMTVMYVNTKTLANIHAIVQSGKIETFLNQDDISVSCVPAESNCC